MATRQPILYRLRLTPPRCFKGSSGTSAAAAPAGAPATAAASRLAYVGMMGWALLLNLAGSDHLQIRTMGNKREKVNRRSSLAVDHPFAWPYYHVGSRRVGAISESHCSSSGTDMKQIRRCEHRSTHPHRQQHDTRIACLFLLLFLLQLLFFEPVVPIC